MCYYLEKPVFSDFFFSFLLPILYYYFESIKFTDSKMWSFMQILSKNFWKKNLVNYVDTLPIYWVVIFYYYSNTSSYYFLFTIAMKRLTLCIENLKINWNYGRISILLSFNLDLFSFYFLNFLVWWFILMQRI
jgi:hypothetical protein